MSYTESMVTFAEEVLCLANADWEWHRTPPDKYTGTVQDSHFEYIMAWWLLRKASRSGIDVAEVLRRYDEKCHAHREE